MLLIKHEIDVPILFKAMLGQVFRILGIVYYKAKRRSEAPPPERRAGREGVGPPPPPPLPPPAPAQDALRGAGDQRAGGAAAPRPARPAERRRRRHPGQAGGARGGHGAGRSGDGDGRLGCAGRAALRLGGGRGGLGRAEPEAQRALRRVPGPRAGAGRRQDPDPLPAAGALAGGQAGDGADLPVRAGNKALRPPRLRLFLGAAPGGEVAEALRPPCPTAGSRPAVPRPRKGRSLGPGWGGSPSLGDSPGSPGRGYWAGPGRAAGPGWLPLEKEAGKRPRPIRPLGFQSPEKAGAPGSQGPGPGSSGDSRPGSEKKGIPGGGNGPRAALGPSAAQERPKSRRPQRRAVGQGPGVQRAGQMPRCRCGRDPPSRGTGSPAWPLPLSL